MQAKFYLNTQKISRHGDRPVYMSITFEGKRIRKPVSGVHCSEKLWDSKKQRIKRPAKANPFDEEASFNNRLDFIDSQLKLIKQSAFDKRTKLTEKFIVERLNDESLIKADRFDFFAMADQYLESIKPVKAKRTIMGKTSAFNFLRDFQRDCQYDLSFQNINLEFFEDLRKYAFETRVAKDKDGKTLTDDDDKTVKATIEDNYFAKIIAVLKTFLNWAVERGYTTDQTFKKFKAVEKETEVICLTLDEFLLLFNHDFKSRRLAQVRDVFVFGCSTGLRFSDLVTLKSSHIGEEFIVKNIQKTKENSMIPLNKYSRAILEKYAGSVQEPLPRVSHQKFNKYIKECCAAVGIDSPISITRFSGGTRKDMTYPKHELVTSHVARKTFTTLSLLLGVPERIVKSITGHKKEENFKRYVNFTKEYEKHEMNHAWDKITAG